jgi:hypothetical protein
MSLFEWPFGFSEVPTMRFKIETALIAVQTTLERLELNAVGAVYGGVPDLVFPAVKIILFRFIVTAHHSPQPLSSYAVQRRYYTFCLVNDNVRRLEVCRNYSFKSIIMTHKYLLLLYRRR